MTYVVRQRGDRELRVRVVSSPEGRGLAIAIEKWNASRGFRPGRAAVVTLTRVEAEQLSKALVAAGVDLVAALQRGRP